MKQRIFENWEFNEYNFLPTNTAEVELVEGLSNKKEGVLGIVKGPSFFGDGFSRNGRFYPKELWENTLKNPEVQRNLERGLMFGCIGHPENYSLDELLASGAVAVRVKDIDFNGKVGNVTYEILDTPAGRILNTILRSGSKPYVSTRAFGSFLNEKKEYNGKQVPILNPNDFYLESIDFVLNPGFLQTDPKLVESIETDLKKLQENNITCIDGICNLKLNEDKEEFKDFKESHKEKYQKNNSKLKSLEKSQLIKIIEDLKKENEFLLNETVENEETDDIEDSSKNTKEDSTEFSKTFKKFKLFIAYLEMLMQLLKYDTSQDELYTYLSGIIDKTDFDMTDVTELENKLNNIIANVSDESVKDMINNILKIIKINKEGSTDSNDNEENVEEGMVNFIYRYYYDIPQTNKALLQTHNKLVKEIKEIESNNKQLKVILQKTFDENKKRVLENSKLNKNIKSLKETLKTYKLKEKELLDELFIKENIIEKELKEQKNIKSELKETKNKLQRVLNNLEETKSQNEELQDALEDLQIEFQIKEKELKENKKYFERKIESLLNNKTEENKIKKLSEELKEANALIKNLKMTKMNENNELSSLKNENKKLNSELNKIKEEFRSIKNELKDKNKIINRLDKKIESLKNENEILNTELKEELNKINNLKELKEKLKNDLENTKKELKEIKNITEIKENDGSKKEINNLQESLNTLKETLNKVNNKSLELENKNKELYIYYLQEKYKFDFDTVKIACEKYDYNEKLVERELNNLNIIRNNEKNTQNYTSFDIKEEEKTIKNTLLENLVN